MILLDTHVLIWLGDGDRRLGVRTRATIEGDDDRRASAMSYWEATMLVRKGRLGFTRPVKMWLDQLLETGGIETAPVTPAIAADAGALPPPLHGDPCDRILIATARALGCPLATVDKEILSYARLGHVQAVDARR